MSASDASPMVPVVLDDYPDDEQSNANTKTSSSVPDSTKVSLADRDDEISDELETMLSLTQTLSFWDDDGDAADDNHDGDDESFGTNSLESWGTYDDGDRRLAPCRGVCGDQNIADASHTVLETLVDTGRAISYVMRNGSKARFPTKEDVEKAKKERQERLQEERKAKREQMLKEEMRTARDEIGKVVSLWREK